MDTKIKIALICYDNPFLLPSEGGKKGIMSRIMSLIYLDKYEVDLYLLCKQAEGIAEIPTNIKEKMHIIKQYPMCGGISTVLGKYPICVNKRYVPECVEELRKHHYDVAVLEGTQVAAYRIENVIDSDHYVIYFHDIESEYRSQIAKSLKNLITKIANKRESFRFKRIEAKVNELFDQVWFVSKDECDKFSKAHLNQGKGIYFPFPAMKFNDTIVGNDQNHRMLYVGDMTVKHNVLSMKWFAKSVLPLIRKRVIDAELVLIGRISDQDKAVLQSLNATVKGYVDDLDQEYKEAACVVCPVLFGAGVKVKTIDSLAMGQIVITNSKGIEGTELVDNKHLLVADTAEKLAEICAEVLFDREKYTGISECGLEYVRSVHSIKHQASLIDEAIKRFY